jgi:hypothetical protein
MHHLILRILERKYWLSISILFGFTISNAQDVQFVLTSAGNFDMSTGAQVGWTVGESIIGGASSLGPISQGFTVVSSRPKTLNHDDWKLSVFPNPAKDVIFLGVDNLTVNKSSYELYDMTGKSLSRGKISKSITEIPIEEYEPSIYFLKIWKEDEIMSTYKIIKL